VNIFGAKYHVHNSASYDRYGAWQYIRGGETNGNPSPWVIIANERTMYVWFGGPSKTATLPPNVHSSNVNYLSGFYGGMCFGDYENNVPGFIYNQHINGYDGYNDYSGTTPAYRTHKISGPTGCGSGGQINYIKIPAYWNGGPDGGDYTAWMACTMLPFESANERSRLGYGWGGLAYPYYDNNELFLERVKLFIGGVHHGWLPGLYQTLHSDQPPTWYPDTFQGTGDFAGMEFIIIPQYRGKLVIRIDADWNTLGVT
jgi:hypothetical protein